MTICFIKLATTMDDSFDLLAVNVDLMITSRRNNASSTNCSFYSNLVNNDIFVLKHENKNGSAFQINLVLCSRHYHHVIVAIN